MPEEEPDGEKEESPDNEQNKDTNTSKEEKDNSVNSEPDNSNTVELTVRSLMIGVFVMGLAIGFSGGVLTGSGTDLVGNMGSEGSPTQPSDSGSNNQGETETINMEDIEMEGEPVLGEEDAPVTIVLYEDFECPFCKKFETESFPKIKSNYIDSGQVNMVWKDYPAPGLGHQWAEPAAAAMECVYRQDNEAFWKIKDKIFSEAKILTRNEERFTPENIQSNVKKFASEEGISESAIQNCIDNGNPMEEVSSDKKEGQELGVTGTPTAFVNGQKIVGAQPYSNFESVIEKALNG